MSEGAVYLWKQAVRVKEGSAHGKSRARLAIAIYYRDVGARFIRKRGTAAVLRIRRKEEFRVFVMIIAGLGLPLTLAYILVAADMRSDLSDLKPTQALIDETTALIGWPELETQDGRPISVEQASWHAKRRVRMLGYMMDGYNPSRDDVRVEMFILMPDAGHLLHPAHRIPTEMVEVWLKRPTPFKFRRLVWVSGVFVGTPGRPDTDKASYAMTDAEVESAAESDITRWFTR